MVVLVVGGPSSADEESAEKPKPLTPEQAADKVLEVLTAKDKKALKALAAAKRPDPWLVADLLGYRGEKTAAIAFSEALSRPDAEALRKYVATIEVDEEATNDHALLANVNAALRARDSAKVVELTTQLPEELDTVVRIRLWRGRGLGLDQLRKPRESYAAHWKSAEAARVIGWLERAGLCFRSAGVSAYQMRDMQKARASFEAWHAMAAELGNDADAGTALGQVALTLHVQGRNSEALKALSRALALQEEHGSKADTAGVLLNMGSVLQVLARYDDALGAFGRAQALFTEVGDRHGAATAEGNRGSVYRMLGRTDEAVAAYKGALRVYRGLRSAGEEARILGNLGNVYWEQGAYGKAIAIQRRSYELKTKFGDREGAARTLLNIGGIQLELGDYAAALDSMEEALAKCETLGDLPGVADAVSNLGVAYMRVGDMDRALSCYQRALKAFRALGARSGVAVALNNIATLHARSGQKEEALPIYEEVVELRKQIGDVVGLAKTLGNVAAIHFKNGDIDKARDVYADVLARQEELKRRPDTAWTRIVIGELELRVGNLPAAREAFERAERDARTLRAVPILVRALIGLARVHLRGGDASQSLRYSDAVLRELEGLLGGLGEEHGALARGRFARPFDVGVVAALQEERLSDAVRFLESGRAGALLDTLDKRETLHWMEEALPDELRRADDEARSAEMAARRAFDAALRIGKRKETRTAREQLDKARDRVRIVAGRIQRELKSQADLFYFRAETIDSIRGSLRANEALVLLGLVESHAVAVVLRTDGARVVRLGSAVKLAAACDALDATDPAVDVDPALDQLRKLVVEPLKLGKDVTQVIVSPEGPLCYLPFGALFDKSIAVTPSGTTHVLLREEHTETGKGVLALGDPDYAGVSKGAQAVYFRGRALSPLPASRKEAEAVGTTSLLGPKASEPGLSEALPAAERWRAIHFACHGLVDVERPMLSSLALSRGSDDDGFLTALEIIRRKMPADLAVLSACETATGQVVKGEGIVGLTRAFMFAGAPRVICSLWKVDDEATRALMIKFYELWNPKEGKGLGAAEALKHAQAHIRAQERWKHPYYWAAWVLWGLPN